MHSKIHFYIKNINLLCSNDVIILLQLINTKFKRLIYFRIILMNQPLSSLYNSNVSSYKNLGITPINDNFMKHINNKNVYDKTIEEEEGSNKPSFLKRYKSFNSFPSKISDRSSIDKLESPKSKLQKADIYSSINKVNQQIAVLQAQITRYGSNQLILKTQKQLLAKQNKRLKQEINYLRQKQSQLNYKNQQLIKNRSRVEILERQYRRLLAEHQKFKSNFNIHMPQSVKNSRQTIFNEPMKIMDQQGQFIDDLPEYRIKIEMPKQNNNEIQLNHSIAKDKAHWKRASGIGTTSIHKILDSNKKINQGLVQIEDLDIKNPISGKLIRYSNTANGNREAIKLSKDKVSQVQHQNASSSSIYNSSDGLKNNTVADQKYINKLKQLQKKLNELQNQTKDLRLKNIQLYGKITQSENNKLKYLQQINQLRYEKSKQLTDQRQRQQDYRHKLQSIKNQLQNANKDKSKLELSNQSYQKTLAILQHQKSQIESKLKQLQENTILYEKDKKNANLMKHKYYQAEQQLISLKRQYTQMKTKYQQQKSVIQQTKSSQKDIYQNKLEQMNQINLALTAQKQALSTEVINIKKQLDRIEIQNKELKQQNRLQIDNALRITKMFQNQKQEKMQLYEQSQSWKQIQKRTKMIKHMNSIINHLWQIKEVQYSNINNTLKQLSKFMK